MTYIKKTSIYTGKELSALRTLCAGYHCSFEVTEKGVTVERDPNYSHHLPFPENIVLSLWGNWRIVEMLRSEKPAKRMS